MFRVRLRYICNVAGVPGHGHGVRVGGAAARDVGRPARAGQARRDLPERAAAAGHPARRQPHREGAQVALRRARRTGQA